MIRLKTLVTLSVAVLIAVGARGRAAEPAPESAEAAAIKAMAAMKAEKYDEFAAAMHPQALKKFRAGMSALVAAADKAGQVDQILPLFPGVKSVDQLNALDDAHFFAAFLASMLGTNPEIKRLMAGAELSLLGHVTEGDTEHVVYRLKTKTADDGEKSLDVMNVASLRRDGRDWKMLLTSDLEGMVVMAERKAAGKAPALPDFAGSTVQVLGRVFEGDDTAHVVYRSTTPVGDVRVNKMGLSTFHKGDPGWEAARDDKRDALAPTLRDKIGLPAKPGP